MSRRLHRTPGASDMSCFGQRRRAHQKLGILLALALVFRILQRRHRDGGELSHCYRLFLQSCSCAGSRSADPLYAYMLRVPMALCINLLTVPTGTFSSSSSFASLSRTLLLRRLPVNPSPPPRPRPLRTPQISPHSLSRGLPQAPRSRLPSGGIAHNPSTRTPKFYLTLTRFPSAYCLFYLSLRHRSTSLPRRRSSIRKPRLPLRHLRGDLYCRHQESRQRAR